MRVPKRVGRYWLLEELGAGGMATVYLGALVGAGDFRRLVAIKMIHRASALDQEALQRFRNEAALASSLHHTNVCQVVDFGEFETEDGESSFYLVMELLQGSTMSKLAASVLKTMDHIPLPIVARVISDAARGLHAAHSARSLETGEALGIVHRDICPQNLFVGHDGVTKVVDFGIARGTSTELETVTGEVAGHLSYMAPERFAGARGDARVDTFALGVVCWELVEGRRLFRRSNAGATMQAILHDPLPTLERSVPKELEELLWSAMAKDPNERPATIVDFAQKLEELVPSVASHDDVIALAENALGPLLQASRDQIAQSLTLVRQLETSKAPDAAMDPSKPTAANIDAPTVTETVTPTPGATAFAAPGGGGRSRIGLAFLALVAAIGAGVWFGGAFTGTSVLGTQMDPATPEAEPLVNAVDAGEGVDAGAVDDALDVSEDVDNTDALDDADGGEEEPAEDEVAARGRVAIAISGGTAEVRVRGRPRGHTPMTLSLPAGRHVIELRSGTWHERVRVNVRANRTTRVSRRLP